MNYPDTAYVDFNFSKVGFLPMNIFQKVTFHNSKLCTGGFNFSKVGASRLSTFCSGSNFLKSWRFAPQKHCLLFSEKQNTTKK